VGAAPLGICLDRFGRDLGLLTDAVNRAWQACRRPLYAGPCDQGVRVRRRVVQTLVVRYENRKTGRAVTLVATAHIGTNAYYKMLSDIIAGLEARGALICYEWIIPAAEKEWAAASDGERAVRGFPGFVGDRVFMRAACRYLGWVEQNAGLKCSPSLHCRGLRRLDHGQRSFPGRCQRPLAQLPISAP
jgi:hypothetical protein